MFVFGGTNCHPGDGKRAVREEGEANGLSVTIAMHRESIIKIQRNETHTPQTWFTSKTKHIHLNTKSSKKETFW